MNCDIPDLLGFVPGARGDVCVELDLVDEGVRGADAVEVFYDFWSRRVEGGPGFVLVEGEGVECCRAGYCQLLFMLHIHSGEFARS